MAQPRNATTCDDTTIDPGGGAPEEGLRGTVVWHRDPQRIGATFWTPWSTRAATLDLGRHEPRFDDGAPLDDHRISRSPLQLVGTPAGLELWPTREGLRFDVDGRPGAGGLRIDAATLQRGVRIGLGKGALVDVRRGPAPRRGAVGTLVGRSRESDETAAAVVSAASAEGHVLVCGESGTGKELVAQALHALGPRRGQAFVAVNAATLSAELGASTGRVLKRPDGRAFCTTNLRTILDRVSNYAGVPKYGPHALRHSFGARLMLNGAGARVAMELLGHSSLSTTQIYAHASKDHRRSAIDMLVPSKK